MKEGILMEVEYRLSDAVNLILNATSMDLLVFFTLLLKILVLYDKTKLKSLL
jgi:hypothetical protein